MTRRAEELLDKLIREYGHESKQVIVFCRAVEKYPAMADHFYWVAQGWAINEKGRGM